jgi:hypothetical protein
MPTASLSKGQVAGIGAVISIGALTGTTGTETFTPIGEINDGKFSGFKRNTTPTTNFNSGGLVTNLSTTLDYGTFTGTVIRVSNDAGQMALSAALVQGGAYDFEIQLEPNAADGQTTTGDLVTFSAIVTEAGAFDLSLTKASEFPITLTINGAVTFTAGS